MIGEEDAEGFATKLAGATERVVHDYGLEDVVHEEPFSDQLCGRLKETLQEFETPRVRWQVDVAMAGRGSGRFYARSLSKYDEEPRFGADLVMVLDIDLPDYSVRKGFIAQAKRLGSGEELDGSNREKLLEQCRRMVSFTPASLVLLYSRHGVHPVSATAVLAARGYNLYSLETYSTAIMYRDFAICWLGDQRIQATDRASLDALRQLIDAEGAVRIQGRARKSKVRLRPRPPFTE